jgi:L-alanine-DL-glutamate epimerase-like enolase superfamily enzyme
MKITSVRSFLLSYPLPEPLKLVYYGGERTILKRDAMFVRVETDKGLVGYAPGQASEKTTQAIDTTIAGFLRGRALSDPDALRVRFFEETGGDPELA